jgi:hypothetical protein
MGMWEGYEHMDKYSMTPGKRPASKTPSRSRQATKAAKLLTKALNVATTPQQNTSPARYLAGCSRLMIMFEGVSKICNTYRSVTLEASRSTYNICDEQQRNSKLILVALHVEVSFQVVKPSIPNIHCCNQYSTVSKTYCIHLDP